MKATHKQIISIFKGMGYSIVEYIPSENRTVMMRSGGRIIAITGSEWKVLSE